MGTETGGSNTRIYIGGGAAGDVCKVEYNGVPAAEKRSKGAGKIENGPKSVTRVLNTATESCCDSHSIKPEIAREIQAGVVGPNSSNLGASLRQAYSLGEVGATFSESGVAQFIGFIDEVDTYRLLAEKDNRYIPKIYDSEIDINKPGDSYVVMEYLPDQLRKVLSEVDQRTKMGLVTQIIDAVQAFHDDGVTLRDFDASFKDDRLRVRKKDDGNGNVSYELVVIDFTASGDSSVQDSVDKDIDHLRHHVFNHIFSADDRFKNTPYVNEWKEIIETCDLSILKRLLTELAQATEYNSEALAGMQARYAGEIGIKIPPLEPLVNMIAPTIDNADQLAKKEQALTDARPKLLKNLARQELGLAAYPRMELSIELGGMLNEFDRNTMANKPLEEFLVLRLTQLCLDTDKVGIILDGVIDDPQRISKIIGMNTHTGSNVKAIGPENTLDQQRDIFLGMVNRLDQSEGVYYPEQRIGQIEKEIQDKKDIITAVITEDRFGTKAINKKFAEEQLPILESHLVMLNKCMSLFLAKELVAGRPIMKDISQIIADLKEIKEVQGGVFSENTSNLDELIARCQGHLNINATAKKIAGILSGNDIQLDPSLRLALGMKIGGILDLYRKDQVGADGTLKSYLIKSLTGSDKEPGDNIGKQIFNAVEG